MPIASLRALFQRMQRDPLALLSARRVGSIATFLGGRELALSHLGVGDWSDVPIAERIAEHYNVTIMPWRSWVDIVESFGADEWDAFDRFLALASTWTDADALPPPPQTAPPPLPSVVDQIIGRPEMFLGAKSVFRMADFVSGYVETVASAVPERAREAAEFDRFCASLGGAGQDTSGRRWFRIMRARTYSDEAAFDDFAAAWRDREKPSS